HPLLRRAPPFREPETWGSGTRAGNARTRHTQNPVRRPLSRARFNDRDRARVPQLPPLAGAIVAPVFHAAADVLATIHSDLPLALRRPNPRAPVARRRRWTMTHFAKRSSASSLKSKGST